MKKLFLVVLLLFAGWCAGTDDGKRFSIRLAAGLGVLPPVVTVDFDKLDGGMKPDSVKALHVGIEYDCHEKNESNSFGDYSCYSDVSLLNGMPALNMNYFFRDGGLSMLRLGMQPASYPAAEKWLDARYQRMDIHAENSFTQGKKYPITVWKTGSGNYLMASQNVTELGEIIVLWTDSIFGIKP